MCFLFILFRPELNYIVNQYLHIKTCSVQFLELAGDINTYLKFMSEKSKFNFVGGIADLLKDLDISKGNYK